MAKQFLWHGESEKRFIGARGIRSVITDPPFGIDNQSKMAVTSEGKKAARKIANDESPEIAIATFKRVMDVVCEGMLDESDIYIFTSWEVLGEWMVWTKEYLTPKGFKQKSVLVWEKDGPGIGDLNSWGNGKEFIIYFKRGNREPTAKRENGVFHIPQIRPNKLIHPHQKPPALLERFIKYSSSEEELVVDPFGGSSSLAKAARSTNRNCITCEYDEYNHSEAVKSFNETGDDFFS